MQMKETRLSKQIVMQFTLAVILCSFLSLTGCVTFWKNGAKESKVDAELSKPVPPAPSQVVPGEPQRGFAQEPTGTRN